MVYIIMIEVKHRQVLVTTEKAHTAYQCTTHHHVNNIQ